MLSVSNRGRKISLYNVVVHPEGIDRMTNKVEPEQTASTLVEPYLNVSTKSAQKVKWK